MCVCVCAHLPHRVKAQAQESEDWTSDRSHHHALTAELHACTHTPLLPLNTPTTSPHLHLLTEHHYTVEPLIMDTPKSRQPPYNGQTVRPLPIYCPYISTSEEGTTSKQWTKCSSPMCPLFGGSTVYIQMQESFNRMNSHVGMHHAKNSENKKFP